MTIIKKDNKIQIEKIETAPFGTNSYTIMCRVTGDSVLIDAPGESTRIIERLKGMYPKFILITHSHMDHARALKELKVLHTPGHTPGSLCFLTDKYLISGDTIFPGGSGRTNTPADLKKIVKSIKEMSLSTLVMATLPS